MLSGPVDGRLLETLVWLIAAEARPRDRHLRGHERAVDGRRAAARAAASSPASSSDEHADCRPPAHRRVARTPTASRSAAGPALETIAALDGPVDLVFIDADKAGYVDYYEAVLPKLSAARADRRRQHAARRRRCSTGGRSMRSTFNEPRRGRPAHRAGAAHRPRRGDADPPGLAPAGPGSLGLGPPASPAVPPGSPPLDWEVEMFDLSEKLQATLSDVRAARHADRGRRQRGDARDPPRAARGRRQLQGRQAVHRDGQGARARRRRRRRAEPRPAGRQDRQRGARHADGRRLGRPGLLAAPADGHPDGRPAGLGQDDRHRQARALPQERARLVGRARRLRRLPPGRGRPARQGRRPGRRDGLRAGHRPRPGRHRRAGRSTRPRRTARTC